MAVWVDGATCAYFFGWVADLGPWTGAWPLMPTGVIDGMLLGDEIDFVIGLPNPLDPTDVTIAFDGSYDSQIWGAYRYLDATVPTPLGTGWFTDHVGSATDPDGSTPPPPGAHLYVNSFFTSQPPAPPPEAYVPASYAAGGTAAFETAVGGWSPWQTGPTVRHAAVHNLPFIPGAFDPGAIYPVSHVSHTGAKEAQAPTSSTYPVPHYPIGSLEPAATSSAQANILAGTNGPAGVSVPYGCPWAIEPRVFSTLNIFGPIYEEATTLQLGIGQASEGWSVHPGYDDVGGSLDYGTDYYRPPFDIYDLYEGNFNGLEFEDAAPSPAWLDLAYLVFGGAQFHAPGDTTTNLTFADVIDLFLATVDPGFAGSGDFYDTTGLTPAVSPTLALAVEMVTNAASGSLSGATVPFSALDGQGSFTVIWQPRWTFSGSSPTQDIPDPTTPTGSTSHSSGGGVAPTINVDTSLLITDSVHSNVGLPYDAVNPRWRYYIPGAIVPAGVKWHNVSGHYAPAGAVPLQINTPGVGWVDIADGLP